MNAEGGAIAILQEELERRKQNNNVKYSFCGLMLLHSGRQKHQSIKYVNVHARVSRNDRVHVGQWV